MTINTKYNIGDSIYSMYNNKVFLEHITRILTSTIKDHKGNIVIEVRYETNNSRCLYENVVFSTKEELLKSL